MLDENGGGTQAIQQILGDRLPNGRRCRSRRRQGGRDGCGRGGWRSGWQRGRSGRRGGCRRGRGRAGGHEDGKDDPGAKEGAHVFLAVQLGHSITIARPSGRGRGPARQSRLRFMLSSLLDSRLGPQVELPGGAASRAEGSRGAPCAPPGLVRRARRAAAPPCRSVHARGTLLRPRRGVRA